MAGVWYSQGVRGFRRQVILQGLLEAGLLNLSALILALGWVGTVAFCLPLGRIGFCCRRVPFAGILEYGGSVFYRGTLFTGLYPSFLLTRIRPADIMRGKLLHGRKGNRMRKMLIVAQFLASFVLVSGTLVVIGQVRYMQQETSSASSNRVLVVKYPAFTDDMSVKMESFKKRLGQIPYVVRVSISGAVPGVEVANYFTNRPYGSDPSEVKLIQMFAVDYDYLALYSPEMLCGRGFSEAYGNERNKVVLNEEAVRLLGYPSPEEALGKQLEMEVLEDPLEVVGVVKNYHQQSLAEPYKPILFFLKERVPFIATPYISVKMDGSVNSDRLAEVEQMYRTYFPSALFLISISMIIRIACISRIAISVGFLPVRHYWQSLWPVWDYGS